MYPHLIRLNSKIEIVLFVKDIGLANGVSLRKMKMEDNFMGDESIFKTREKIQEYLKGLGFIEKNTASFDWSANHPELGIINFLENGRRISSNRISTNMRDNCGFSTSSRKKFDNKKKEEIYNKYLQSKPYYKDIKYGMKFHFRKSATDYISLPLGLGFDRLKEILDSEFSNK